MSKIQPAKHIFVDFENVHEIDLSAIDDPSTRVTILVGRNQTKIDTSLVEQMLARPGMIEMVRLSSSGRNALDFALVYYLGRAVASAGETMSYVIVSRDTGYDPLIDHLRYGGLDVRRSDKFAIASGHVAPVIAKAAEPKAAPKTVEAKAANGKTVEVKTANRKGMESKTATDLAVEVKAANVKTVEVKAAEVKPSEVKEADEDLADMMCDAMADMEGLPKTRKKLESFLRHRFGKGRTKFNVKATISQMVKHGWIRDVGNKIEYWFDKERPTSSANERSYSLSYEEEYGDPEIREDSENCEDHANHDDHEEDSPFSVNGTHYSVPLSEDGFVDPDNIPF